MASEEERGERLIERLVSDPAFRAAFRRDPVATARSAGLEGFADELLAAGSDPLQTLDVRESRSSLAGVAMAAALEGLGDVSDHAAHASSSPEDLAAPRAAQGHERIDPDQYGMEGAGGPPSPETTALLHNRRVTFDADGIADLKAGRIDPRLVSMLTKLSGQHTLTISAMASDHPRLTAGGSISNHYYGRALDIATVDGQPVGPGNEAAKQVALELAHLNRSIRPTEIGSPWPLSGPAYFSDAAHQNHLHIGFDDPIARTWQPPQAEQAPLAAAPAPSDDAPSELPPPDDSQDDSTDDSQDDSTDDSQDDSDDDVREDGGSGDTEAEADDESDDDADDDDSDDDDDEDDEEDDEDEDEDEDEPDEQGPDHDDLTDDEVAGGSDDSRDVSSSAGDGESGAQAGEPAPAQWQEPDLEGGGYPGDDSPKEQLAAWMAGEARQRGIPSELPVMASLVESSLSNLNHGDADSVGFFQMRVGIWNQGAYAGYPDDPKRQIDWFLDQAVAVKKQRVAQGLPVDDPQHYGDWIADIERPAAEYRGRYQPRLAEARELLEQAAGSSRRSPEPRAQSADVLRLRVIDPEEARRARDNGG